MGVFGEKNPLLIDLDRGICGTFVGVEAEGTEPGWVHVVYTPFNSFKHVKYTHAIPKSAMHYIHPQTDAPGIDKQIIFIFQGGEESLVKFIDQKNIKLIRELENRVKDLEIEKATAQQRAEEAYTGAEKIVQKTKQITKTDQKDPSQFDPLGGQQRKYFEEL